MYSVIWAIYISLNRCFTEFVVFSHNAFIWYLVSYTLHEIVLSSVIETEGSYNELT